MRCRRSVGGGVEAPGHGQVGLELGAPHLGGVELDPVGLPLVGVDAVGGPEAADLSEDGGPVPAGVLELLEARRCGARPPRTR